MVRGRPGGQHDVLSHHQGGVALTVVDGHDVGGTQSTGPVIDGDVPTLQERRHSLGQPIDDLLLTDLAHRQVDDRFVFTGPGDAHPEGGCVADGSQHGGRLQ